EPCLRKFVPYPFRRLRPGGDLVDPSRQIMEPCVQDRTFGLGVRGDLLEAVAEARLDLLRALLERRERLVALPVEARSHPPEPVLDALHARVRDVLDAPRG